jgi:hypothetical protein
MTGKNSNNGYNVLQGGVGNIIADPSPPTDTATSGGAEPTWPTTLYDTVADGGVTWTAIYARKTTGVVNGVLNGSVFQHTKTVYPNHYFQYGTLTWLTGANAGFECDIRDSGGVVNGSRPYIYALELMPNPVQVGDTFTATVGCAKTRFACQYFNNVDNLRAFPDMPTEERALATPNISNQGYAPSNTK